MALCSDAAMVLYYDIAGETADHDDWHTYEHMHERLAIRGADAPMGWLLLATGYDDEAVQQAVAAHLDAATLGRHGIEPGPIMGQYGLHYTATALEAARMPPNPSLSSEQRHRTGPRL